MTRIDTVDDLKARPARATRRSVLGRAWVQFPGVADEERKANFHSVAGRLSIERQHPPTELAKKVQNLDEVEAGRIGPRFADQPDELGFGFSVAHSTD